MHGAEQIVAAPVRYELDFGKVGNFPGIIFVGRKYKHKSVAVSMICWVFFSLVCARFC